MSRSRAEAVRQNSSQLTGKAASGGHIPSIWLVPLGLWPPAPLPASAERAEAPWS